MSQSLIHQVSVSDSETPNYGHSVTTVSIPYSSGLSFRCHFLSNDLLAIRLQKRSQSLIHQVSVSDVIIWICIKNGMKSLNPLFIRSQFQISHCSRVHDGYLWFVSIPYSSGLSFRYGEIDSLLSWKIKSQSLIHQVSVSDEYALAMELHGKQCLNPLFIRSQFQIL